MAMPEMTSRMMTRARNVSALTLPDRCARAYADFFAELIAARAA